MAGWHHWPNGHEFEQAPGVGDGHGFLACCSPWGRKKSDMTEQLNWTHPTCHQILSFSWVSLPIHYLFPSANGKFKPSPLIWIISIIQPAIFASLPFPTSTLSSVQSLSCVWLFVTPWTTAHQASLSITNSWSLLKLMSIKSVMPSSHLILCRPLLLQSVTVSPVLAQLRQIRSPNMQLPATEANIPAQDLPHTGLNCLQSIFSSHPHPLTSASNTPGCMNTNYASTLIWCKQVCLQPWKIRVSVHLQQTAGTPASHFKTVESPKFRVSLLQHRAQHTVCRYLSPSLPCPWELGLRTPTQDVGCCLLRVTNCPWPLIQESWVFYQHPWNSTGESAHMKDR